MSPQMARNCLDSIWDLETEKVIRTKFYNHIPAENYKTWNDKEYVSKETELYV